jgi:phosphomannomutase
MRPISFGTDGWRGIISFDFTFPRAVIVAEAVRRYLAETGYGDKPVLIGYDNRFLAQEFAANTANYLSGAGQPVSVFSATVPTPVCAFGVMKLQAAGALMFTASHNPFYYLGIKFIPYFAGPAEAETTQRITEIIREIEASGMEIPPLNTTWNGDRLDLHSEYFARLSTFVDALSLRKLEGKLLYAAFYGVGAGWVDRYLGDNGVRVETVFANRDVLFGGSLPDPSPSNMDSVRRQVDASGYSLILATDGDADRFGLMTPDGTYFGCNQILPMLADFLLTVKGKRGRLVRTVATSHLLDRVAKAHGVELTETPVGFKYVGRELREGALIGGEESGGLSIAGHVPEKDAILSIMLLLDSLATSGKSLSEAWKAFKEKYGDSCFERIDLEIEGEHRASLICDVRSQLGSSSFLGKEVASSSSLDGSKFIFSDGSWVLFRPSGTESVVRIYIEAENNSFFASLRTAVEKYLSGYAGAV